MKKLQAIRDDVEKNDSMWSSSSMDASEVLMSARLTFPQFSV
jgi:hypothetical protein